MYVKDYDMIYKKIIAEWRCFMKYDIDVNWDEEAGVWYAVCDNIPIALESNSFDALVARVKIASYEILELNGKITENIQLCFKATHWERIA